MNKIQNSLTHIKSMDGIRGILCVWVLLAHWNLKLFSSGWIAMGIFFTISGILISRILKVQEKASFKDYYLPFIINRALRILPLYYFSIVLFFIIIYFTKDYNDQVARSFEYYTSKAHYILFYGVNFLKFEEYGQGFVFYGANFFGHFWSLSVEEQFYIFFPFLIFFLNKKLIKALCIIAIFFTPIASYIFVRHYEVLGGVSWARSIIYQFTFFRLDAFAVGIALIYFDFNWLKNPKLWAKVLLFITAAYGLTVWLVSYYNNGPLQLTNLGMDLHTLQFHLTGIWLVDYRFIISSFLANLTIGAILLCAIKEDKPFAKILENKHLIFLGKRSYAYYVYHLPIFTLSHHFKIIDVKKVMSDPLYSFTGFMIYFVLMIIVSHLSYEYFEKWFFRFKRSYNITKA